MQQAELSGGPCASPHGISAGAGGRVSRLSGEFLGPELEARFRHDFWPQCAQQVRVTALVGALAFLITAYTDYLSLGGRAGFYVLLTLRSAVMLAAVGLTWITLGQRRVKTLDFSTAAGIGLMSTTFLVAVVVRADGMMYHAASAIIMLLGYYLYVPIRTAFVLINTLYLSLGFVVLALVYQQPDAKELSQSLILLVACNVLGALSAVHMAALRRQQYLSVRELNERAHALARSNSDLQRFAYAASHDLKEPLRSIAGFSGLLERRYRGRLDPQADEFIGHMAQAAQRMQCMIDDLMAYSRVESQKRPHEACDIGRIVALARDNLRVSIEEQRAAVTHDDLPTVAGDPAQILQLLQNLIGNAIKFHDGRPPQVHIGARRSNGAYEFAVADNGIGIDPDHAQRIFEVFTRLHGRDEYPGTGIGLAICKRIVERHGGRIWVEPNVPQGSIFRFTLGA